MIHDKAANGNGYPNRYPLRYTGTERPQHTGKLCRVATVISGTRLGVKFEGAEYLVVSVKSSDLEDVAPTTPEDHELQQEKYRALLIEAKIRAALSIVHQSLAAQNQRVGVRQ